MVPRREPISPGLIREVSLNVLYPEPPNQNDGHRIRRNVEEKEMLHQNVP